MSLQVWFHNLFRPKVTSVKAVLYDNGKEVSIEKYSEAYLRSLLTAINDLWKVEAGSPYWFETDIYEHKKCFQRKITSIHVECYTRNMLENGFKSKYAIPVRYRRKMFDKPHPLKPEPVGQKQWSNNLEVRFLLPRD